MKGCLFIGDPHVTGKNPGRRCDNYLESVIGKLERAAEIAREHDLLPVILGDLFHRPAENDLRTLLRLIVALKRFHVKPLCNGGNHDKGENLLTEVDALYLLNELGIIEVFDGECQLAHVLDTPVGPVHLYMAPYGAQLPGKIESEGSRTVVLVTHHDLAFAGAYPGAAQLREIQGCDMVVNGHMHKTTPSVRTGCTMWHNPGNIEPLSIDCIDHEPAVWAWCPSEKGGDAATALQRIMLPHQRDCFDLTGLQVAAAPAKAAVGALATDPGVTGGVAPPIVEVAPAPVLASSQFAALLSEEVSTMEAPRKRDNSAFMEDLKGWLAELDAGSAVQGILLSLAERVNLQ